MNTGELVRFRLEMEGGRGPDASVRLDSLVNHVLEQVIAMQREHGYVFVTCLFHDRACLQASLEGDDEAIVLRLHDHLYAVLASIALSAPRDKITPVTITVDWPVPPSAATGNAANPGLVFTAVPYSHPHTPLLSSIVNADELRLAAVVG